MNFLFLRLWQIIALQMARILFMAPFMAIIISSSVYSAEFTSSYLTNDSGKESPMGCSFDLFIKGSIKKGDATRLKNILDNACYEKSRYKLGIVTMNVNLNSDGGDVSEAIEMGRVIRAKGAFTRVWNHDSCLSSCVFILMGGQSRQAIGKVGIHRPYFSDLSPNSSLAQIQKAREEMNSKISQYIKEMDIAPTIVEVIMSVPPEKMKILTELELERYRLDGTDAAYDEKQVAEYAQSWNITSAEYRQRDSISKERCGRYNEKISSVRDWQVCVWSTMLAIPSTQAEKKIDLMKTCPSEPQAKRAECLRKLRTPN